MYMTIWLFLAYLGIKSHFIGVHGPYELHQKEKQIKCTALAVHENLLFFPMQFIWPVVTRCMKICFSFRCNSYGPWTPTKCDSIFIFTSFNNKVCCDIAYFNAKMSYLSDFKGTKSKTLRTAKQTEDKLNKSAVLSSANNTNKRLTFLKFDYRKYSNFLLLYKSTCHLRLKWTQRKTF